MGDADGSYDFSNLNPFIRKFEQNFDVVCGNRFKGGIEKNAMPFLHKYIGNPILSYIGRLFFSLKALDKTGKETVPTAMPAIAKLIW